MTTTPLSGLSSVWKPIPQQIVEIPATKRVAVSPDGMVRIPASSFLFKVRGIEIEGANDVEVDVQYPWEDMARRFHEKKMQLDSFYMDKYPVTNAEFKKFLDASHYHPQNDLNFLRDWSNGNYPDGWANKPVTWVSIEDARAYAKWAGKRLPHEWEWQFAAQSNDHRLYPWGNCSVTPPISIAGLPLAAPPSVVSSGVPVSGPPSTLSQASLPGSPVMPCNWGSDPKDAPLPIADRGRGVRAASDVDAHPRGASPFGVMDMVGNVWQWTDEYTDEHTRSAILRGGSHYQPVGSIWYFPQAYRNDEHGKLLLMAPSYDRSGTLGFRCVVDAR